MHGVLHIRYSHEFAVDPENDFRGMIEMALEMGCNVEISTLRDIDDFLVTLTGHIHSLENYVRIIHWEGTDKKYADQMCKEIALVANCEYIQ